jgi:uncharacterized YccA/Bax inhibitor family protein
MTSSNPALSEQAFRNEALSYDGSVRMTFSGAMMKTAMLSVILFTTAAVSWTQFRGFQAGTSSGGTLMMLLPFTGIIGFLVGLVTTFVPRISPYTAPIYAAFQGAFLGLLSARLESLYSGIVMQAVGLTFGTFGMMLGLYISRIITVTDKLRVGIIAATGGIALTYLATFILSFFGINVPFIHDNGAIGIAFSVFVVGVAAFNLLLDFDFIERASRSRAPTYMEWYSAFGLMVTLIWLYIEFLRLLSKLRSRE